MSIDREAKQMSEGEIAALLAQSGARLQPPGDLADEIFLNVKSVWQEEVNQRKKTLRQRYYAIAAGFMLMIGAGVMFISTPDGAAPGVDQFANVTQAVNVVEQRLGEQPWTAVSGSKNALATSLKKPQALRTGADSYAFVELDTGFEIRLDANTQVILSARDEIQVVAGAIYVDSNQIKGGTQLWINTPFGRTRDIGTQYEVRLLGDNLQVQVREGTVDITHDKGQWIAEAGERVVVADGREVSRSELKPDDGSWHWTQNVGKKYQIDGQSLDAYLHWLGRESGKVTVYQSEEVQTAAKATILHGSIDDLSASESLTAVLATTNFHLVPSESDTIVVGK